MSNAPVPEGALGFERVSSVSFTNPRIVEFGNPANPHFTDARLVVPDIRTDPATGHQVVRGVYLCDPSDAGQQELRSREKYFPVGPGPLTIGRDPGSDVVLENEYASVQHASLELANRAFTLRDEGSTNGTYQHLQDQAVCEYQYVGSTIDIEQGHWGSVDLISMQGSIDLILGEVSGRLHLIGDNVYFRINDQSYDLGNGRSFRVGRGDQEGADIVLPTDEAHITASRNHATIVRVGDRVLVRNNSKTNSILLKKLLHEQNQEASQRAQPPKPSKQGVVEPRELADSTEQIVNPTSVAHVLSSDNHGCHDTTANGFVRGADGKIRQRNVVMDGSGGSMGELTGLKDQVILDAMNNIQKKILKENGVTPGDAIITADAEYRAEASRAGIEGPYGAVAVVDIGSDSIDIASAGDVAVCFWREERYSHRRLTGSLADEYLGGPSPVKSVNIIQNLAHYVKNSGQVRIPTGALDDDDRSNRIMNVVGEPSQRAGNLYSGSIPYDSYEPDFVLMGSDGSRLSGMALDTNTPYAQKVDEIMTNLKYGRLSGTKEEQMQKAAREIAQAARAIPDNDDITVRIIDVRDIVARAG